MLRGPGGAAYLAAPIPQRVGLVLPLLTSLAVREWVIVTDDDAIAICGHDFRIVGWTRGGHDAEPGLVLEHDCHTCGHA